MQDGDGAQEAPAKKKLPEIPNRLRRKMLELIHEAQELNLSVVAVFGHTCSDEEKAFTARLMYGMLPGPDIEAYLQYALAAILRAAEIAPHGNGWPEESRHRLVLIRQDRDTGVVAPVTGVACKVMTPGDQEPLEEVPEEPTNN